MTKIVLNVCYGGFSLSEKAVNWLKDKGMRFREYDRDGRDVSRSDPLLIQCVEELGDDVNGSHARLKIKTIPDTWDDMYEIEEYDGKESIRRSFMCLKDWVLHNLDSLTPHNVNEWKAQLRHLLE
jgi:hypothetical protein